MNGLSKLKLWLQMVAVSAVHAYFHWVAWQPVRDRTMVNKVLVFTNPGIGDCLTSTPAIRALAKKYDQVDIVCYPQAYPIFKNNKYINHIWIGKTLTNIFNIRSEHYDMAVCYNLFTEPIYAYLCGIPIRTGEDKNGFALTHKFRPMETDNTISWLKRIAGVEDDKSTNLDLRLDKVTNKEQPCNIVVVPDSGTTDLAKRKSWPAQNFAELCNLIGEPVTICGTDEQVKGDVAARLAVPCERMHDQTLNEFASTIKLAKLVICNDSAAMHIAAAFNVPCVTIFGPTNPDWLAHSNTTVIKGKCPYGYKQGCFHIDDVLFECTRPCLLDTTPEEVSRRLTL